MVNERRWLASVFILYFLLAFGFSLLMPIWEAPDEPAHYHLAWRVARGKSYPTFEHNYETHQPRAYYYAASLVIRALDRFDPRLSDYYLPPREPRNYRKPVRMFFWTAENKRPMLGVYSLRWANILLGALALWLNWKAFRLLAPEKPSVRLAALALGALTPQYLHIMSSVSNDAAGTVAGALLFYFAILFIKKPSRLLGLASCLLALLLPFISKLTVLPVSAAVVVILMWRWLFRLGSERWLLFSGLAVVLGAGVFYLIFPESMQSALSEIKWRLFSFRKNAFTARYLKFILSQVIWSYWGRVGWLAVGLHAYIVNGLTALGVTGLAFHAIRWIKPKKNDPHFAGWSVTWFIGIFTLLAVFRNALTTSATQGRFLFPAIGALSILVVRGWHDLLPERIRPHLPLIVIILMTGCTLLLWQFGVLPVYYRQALD